MPRYDIKTAAWIAEQIARKNKDRGEQWIAQSELLGPVHIGPLRLESIGIGPYGVSRLWAGIVLGYLVIALQSDGWKLGHSLVMDRLGQGIILGVILAGVSLLFLVHGISRATGIPDFWLNFARARLIWLNGEVFALLAGIIVAALISPYFLAEAGVKFESVGEILRVYVPLVPLYAQFAIFVGIFTQLLFDESPVTKRLGRP